MAELTAGPAAVPNVQTGVEVQRMNPGRQCCMAAETHRERHPYRGLLLNITSLAVNNNVFVFVFPSDKIKSVVSR